MFFTLRKLEKRLPELRAAIHRETRDIPVFRYFEGEVPGAERPDFDDSAWQNFSTGDTWGGYDSVAWFRARVAIPDGWQRRKLALRFLVGPRDGAGSTAETLLYVNGAPLQAIDVWHEEAWLPPEFLSSGEISVALKAWSGVWAIPDRRRFKLAQLVWIDPAAETLYYVASTLVKAVRVLHEDDLRRWTLLQALNEAYLLVDFGKPGSDRFYESLAAAAELLCDRVGHMEQLHELKPRVVGIGHAHIDMAWLWRLMHTREKAARTFSTALHLMRQYPEYRFMHSSPQLYKFLKHDYPDIFAQVKEKIAAGQWEVTGATWVEPDVNIPSGESLVRQFLFGRRFVRDEFGKEMSVLWLPDVFGYSYALPQIIRRSGITYFLTSKISWNQYNRFPYDTFRWRGLDGAEVLTHFVTAPEENSHIYTYNAQVRPHDVKGIWDSYRQKDLNDELLLLYGFGDGGGGPTQEMLENARWQKNLPGIPTVELDTAEHFFERLGERVSGRKLPVWDGELYLEYHRGTYTSQAYNKRANRKAEILYHNAEWLGALAGILNPSFEYPSQSLNEGWELILLNQFHDILPGSSTHAVYEDSRQDYERITEVGERAVSGAMQSLTGNMALSQDSIVVFNSLSWQRGDLIELPWSQELSGKSILGAAGQSARTQVVAAANEKAVLIEVDQVPSLGYRAYPLVDSSRAAPGEASSLTITPAILQNRFYRIDLNDRGQITSLLDKQRQREVIAPGERGNVFQVFEDKPIAFDAWDIDLFYQEKMREVSQLVAAEVEEIGPLRGVLRLEWRYEDSIIVQRLTLYDRSPRIDFRTEVDWQERQVLLKVAFPVSVRATRATYDIQFGSIERPTHWNTSWDYARFETLGHKWADLSEGDYGVALLNDCKYGHDIKDHVMRLTLIKSAIDPDPLADQGRHIFTYSLLPHSGGWREADVPREAYALNVPLLGSTVLASAGDGLPSQLEFASVDAGHVIVETVKKAEREDAWIVRVYEYRQCRSSGVTLRFAQPLRSAVECNLMEEQDSPVEFDGDCLTFPINPFEIKTFRVKF